MNLWWIIMEHKIWIKIFYPLFIQNTQVKNMKWKIHFIFYFSFCFDDLLKCKPNIGN